MVLLSVAVPAAAQPVAAPALPGLIELYLSWRGGAAFENLQSIHVRSRADDQGRASNEYWLDRSGRFRDQFDFGGVIKTQVRAPGLSWSINPSGQIEDADPRGPLKARRRALVEFGAALRGAEGAQVQLLNPMRRIALGDDKEQEWAVIGVRFDDADIYGLLIDPKTGQLCATIIEESGQTFVYDYADWRKIDGARLPFWIVQGGDSDNRTLHVSSFELNKPFAPSLFERPVPPGKARGKSSGWIDFTLEGGNIRLPVRVNGKPAEAFLDNGAQISLVDAQFAGEAGLTLTDISATMHGVGPSTDIVHWVKNVTFEVGAMTIPDLTISSEDMSQLARMAGTPVPLLLGDEVFSELVVDIDFPRRRIRFDKPDGFVPPAGAVEVPVIRNNGVDSIPLSIEQRSPIQVDLDLGSGDALDLFPDYAKAQKLLDGRPTSQSMFGGIGGIQTETDVILHGVRLGGADIADVTASVLPERVRGTYSNEVQGSVGVPILRRYRLIFDYPHHRLFVQPDPDAIAASFGRNRLGVSWLPDGDDLVVLLVVPNSPAAAAGLKVGDRIARIDGKPAGLWKDSNARLALKEGPAGTKLSFTLVGGEIREPVLADYY